MQAQKPPGNDAQVAGSASVWLALAFAPDELLYATIRFVVGHLDRRMLRKISRRGMQHAADAPIQRKLATTDGVDRHAR